MAEPKNWQNCPIMGQIVADIFVPFKTPFGQKLTPEMVMKKFQDENYNVRLWIDLTNTNRYYDSNIIKNNDYIYKKIKIEGHGKCPNQETIKLFIDYCSEFLSSNRRAKIAIHCTHGFNRTGFLICSYLVQKLNWPILDAIQHFSECRSPGIYRREYIEKLIQTYSYNYYNDIRLIRIPSKPEWIKDDHHSRQYNHNNNNMNWRRNFNRNNQSGSQYSSRYNRNDDYWIKNLDNLHISN